MKGIAAVLCAWICMLASAAVHANNAGSTLVKLNIATQPVRTALKELSDQAKVQVLLRVDNISVDGVMVPEVIGELTVGAALDRLLENTGLRYEFVSERTIRIAPVPPTAKAMQLTQAGVAPAAGAVNENEGRKGPADSLISPDVEKSTVEEIIVTAQKRSERLQDVPISITALSGEELSRRGAVSMQDYLNTVPGVTIQDQGAGVNFIAVRGVIIDPYVEAQVSGPTVGIYLGDIPISGFGFAGNADLKLVDIERVEVLRGPQGTLFGSGSMGGVIRNIPNAPHLKNFVGDLSVGYSQTSGEGGNNTDVRGVINLPLVEDRFAIRIVGYRMDNSGYYKNIAAGHPATQQAVSRFGAVATNQDRVGGDEYIGGRVSALWQANDALGINFQHVTQKIEQFGLPQAELAIGDAFEQKRLLQRTSADPNAPLNTEALADRINIDNLTIQYELGAVDLFASASWVDEKTVFNRDLAPVFAYTPLSQNVDVEASASIQEVRAASQLGGPLEFVAGLYREKLDRTQTTLNFFGGTPSLNPFGSNLTITDIAFPRVTEQRAAFSDVSYAITEQWSVAAGVRYFEYDRRDGTSRFGGAATFYDSKETGTTGKASLEFAPSENRMFYAKWSEGFRLGRPVEDPNPATIAVCDVNGDGMFDTNPGFPGGPGVPVRGVDIESDVIDTYELGGKLALFGRRLTIDAALYQLNWDGIPVSVLFGPGCAVSLNAGRARSRGIELQSGFNLTRALQVNLGVSYVDAQLLESVRSLGAVEGDRLPGSAPFNLSIGLQHEFEIARYPAFVRGDYGYGDGFNSTLSRRVAVGDSHMVNVRAGMSIGKLDAELFVRNLTNSDALTSSDDVFPDQRVYRLRPRTIGLQMGYRFGQR